MKRKSVRDDPLNIKPRGMDLIKELSHANGFLYNFSKQSSNFSLVSMDRSNSNSKSFDIKLCDKASMVISNTIISQVSPKSNQISKTTANNHHKTSSVTEQSKENEPVPANHNKTSLKTLVEIDESKIKELRPNIHNKKKKKKDPQDSKQNVKKTFKIKDAINYCKKQRTFSLPSKIIHNQLQYMESLVPQGKSFNDFFYHQKRERNVTKCHKMQTLDLQEESASGSRSSERFSIIASQPLIVHRNSPKPNSQSSLLNNYNPVPTKLNDITNTLDSTLISSNNLSKKESKHAFSSKFHLQKIYIEKSSRKLPSGQSSSNIDYKPVEFNDELSFKTVSAWMKKIDNLLECDDIGSISSVGYYSIQFSREGIQDIIINWGKLTPFQIMTRLVKKIHTDMRISADVIENLDLLVDSQSDYDDSFVPLQIQPIKAPVERKTLFETYSDNTKSVFLSNLPTLDRRASLVNIYQAFDNRISLS